LSSEVLVGTDFSVLSDCCSRLPYSSERVFKKLRGNIAQWLSRLTPYGWILVQLEYEPHQMASLVFLVRVTSLILLSTGWFQ